LAGGLAFFRALFQIFVGRKAMTFPPFHPPMVLRRKICCFSTTPQVPVFFSFRNQVVFQTQSPSFITLLRPLPFFNPALSWRQHS